MEDGGLGLHHLESKAQAHLIATFIQTAAGKIIQISVFYSWLYRYHVYEETHLPDPGYTPHYYKNFFQEIKKVKEDSPLNPICMTIREVDQKARWRSPPARLRIGSQRFAWQKVTEPVG